MKKCLFPLDAYVVSCPTWSKSLDVLYPACLHCDLQNSCVFCCFFYRRKTAKCCHFFLRTTPATIVCLFSVHQASLASLHCLLLKKMHRFQEDFRSGKNDYQVYFLLPSTKCDFFVRKYSWVVVMNPSRTGLSHTSSWRIFIPALLGLCPFSAHLEIKD